MELSRLKILKFFPSVCKIFFSLYHVKVGSGSGVSRSAGSDGKMFVSSALILNWAIAVCHFTWISGSRERWKPSVRPPWPTITLSSNIAGNEHSIRYWGPELIFIWTDPDIDRPYNFEIIDFNYPTNTYTTKSLFFLMSWYISIYLDHPQTT